MDLSYEDKLKILGLEDKTIVNNLVDMLYEKHIKNSEKNKQYIILDLINIILKELDYEEIVDYGDFKVVVADIKNLDGIKFVNDNLIKIKEANIDPIEDLKYNKKKNQKTYMVTVLKGLVKQVGYKVEGFYSHAKIDGKNKSVFKYKLVKKEETYDDYDIITTKPNYNRKLCKSNETHDIPCPVTANPKYDDYCTHCFGHLFPDDPRTLLIRTKSKELKVRDFINSKYDGFVHDKPLYVDLEGGCCVSKRRIDLRKLIRNTLLCIEIDEHQHKSYNKNDEEIRYDNLFMDFSRKYIFIRYNPDEYETKDEIIEDPPFDYRMGKLEEMVYNMIDRIKKDQNKEFVEIYYLFYDEDD